LGAKVGAALVSHPAVRTVSFTGGTKTGAEIARLAAPAFKKLTLELGGKNPNIVFADADLDEAVRTSVRAAFENQGQICLCGSRLFVQSDIFSEFLGRFLEAIHRLKVGDPLDPTTDQGALISRNHRDKVESYLRMAEEQGGQVLVGGRRPVGLEERFREGYFLEPAVVGGLDADHCFN